MPGILAARAHLLAPEAVDLPLAVFVHPYRGGEMAGSKDPLALMTLEESLPSS